MPFVIGIILLIMAYIMYRFKKNKNYCVERFRKGNIIIFGAKGRGKDLFMQKIIHARKREPYYSNIPYGYNGKPITIADLTVSPNTYENLIQGEYTKVPDRFGWDTDVYVSDGGIYLPSQYDSLLSKEYPSLPIFYALSRQLHNMNLHINTQALNRIWIKLREQADGYFKALGTIKIPFFGMIVRVRYFEHYESAKQNILPFQSILFNKDAKSRAMQHHATFGIIKDMSLFIRYKNIKYDTYYFRKLLIEESDTLSKKDKKS